MGVLGYLYYDVFPCFAEKFYPYYCSRTFTKFIMRYFDKNRKLVVVEIGVSSGKNAFNICQMLGKRLKKLYLIDPYVEYVDVSSSDKSIDHSQYEQIAKKRLKYYVDKGLVVFIKKTAVEGFSFIPDGVDAIYHDGNHQAENVYSECKLFYSKLKTDGVIGGHDFQAKIPGVAEGCTHFIKEYNLELCPNWYCDSYPDWWTVKK